MKYKLLSVFSLLAALAGCGKQSPPVTDPAGNVIVSDRLSNQRVNAFAEDTDGHIWIATSRGLNQYSVYEYHQYFHTDDTLGLPDNVVNHVFSASSGELWAATDGGVAFQTPEGRFRRVPVLGGSRGANQIWETRDGKILMSNSATLYQLDREADCFRPAVRDFNAFSFPYWVQDGNLLWVISGGGSVLNCYNTDDFSLVESFPTPHIVYHLCDTGNGELWMSGMGRMSIFDIRYRTWKELPAAIRNEPGLMQGDIDIIYSVDDRSILLNVIGKGMYHYSRTAERVLRQDDAGFPFNLPDSEIRTIFRDSRHNLWFGTADQGYTVSYQYQNQFNSNKFLTSAFDRKTVTSLCLDQEQRLWITTFRDGLWVYDIARKELKPVDDSSLLPDTSVGYIRCSKVYCDRDGDLWVLFQEKYTATRCRFDGTLLHRIDSFFLPNVSDVVDDGQGHIWAGGQSSYLLRYDKASREVTPVPVWTDQTPSFITDLEMSEQGWLLIASTNRLLTRVNTFTGEVEELELTDTEKQSCLRFSTLRINRLRKDSAGDLWLATTANGLLRHGRKEEATTPLDGAPCLDICSIEEDRQGNIWVSTMNGLGKYDRTVGKFVNYFEEDGIGGNQFSERASCVLPDGTLVFGGTHGLTWFNPLDVPQKRSVPLVFEDLKVHNDLVTPGKDSPIVRELRDEPDIVLRDDQNAFSISFAALDYSEHERTHYYYMLDGFDRDWVDAGNNHEAYYANVPAGSYRFRVRITNNNQSIVETEKSLAVKILPPWYGTWWAWILYLLTSAIILGSLWTLVRRIRRVRKDAARRVYEARRERERVEKEKDQERRMSKIQMNYFANVAHEFRTPLTMIVGPVSQLAESEDMKGQDRKLVGIIQRSATWMLSLVNQLLDFNRIGDKKLQLRAAKGDIVAPLRGIADLFRFNAGSKGIELVTYGLEDSFEMWADVDKVQKIVMNLMSNAMKFTPSGGRVTLAFDVVPREEAAAAFPLTKADKDTQYAQITVSDTGCGIPDGQLEKIFERFYQADNQGDTQGSGIGLYYSRALTGLHHGYIKAENRPEGGAAFSVILPVSASSYTDDERSEILPVYDIPAPAGTEMPAEAPGDEDRKRIAVVDDDIDIANYVKVLLSPYYNVSVYFDAASALKGMEDEIPDLVISDVVMPGKSGYELCKEVKSNLQLSHIPVVLVTAKVAVENQVQGLREGADAYVTKPFQPAYLLALVKSLLDNREKLHQRLGSVTTTEDIEPEALSPRDAAFMKELYELMEKELANVDLDITRITEMMKISRTKFYYKVKGLTGENPSVFFKRYKLNRAADLLKEGKYNMSEIAYMTGFNTLSHFSTSFKKQFGVPPSEFGG
jgi:signal transduction histidine kinase/ligand-binding sensor domain-containing protein/DNA-binding response OmpR family regulator